MTTDLTNIATLLTALRGVLGRDVLNKSSMCRERTMRYVDTQLEALSASGLVVPSQVNGYGVVGEMRSELVHSLYGSDTATRLALAGLL